MTVDPISIQPFDEQEISKLSARIASQTLEDIVEEAIEDDEPKASKSTPESRKPPALTEDGRKILFVAGTSKSKSVAAVIARIVRSEEDQAPVLSAVGAASVNQAVKAIAIARTYLSSNEIELEVEVSRQPQKEVRDVIMLKLIKKKVEEPAETEAEVIEMKSSAKSTPGALAGAIAANIRESKLPKITAIGKGAVFRAICAISVSRKYLEKEETDVVMLPKFTQVNFDNGTIANAIELTVQKVE